MIWNAVNLMLFWFLSQDEVDDSQLHPESQKEEDKEDEEDEEKEEDREKNTGKTEHDTAAAAQMEEQAASTTTGDNMQDQVRQIWW